jgi:hypothetical protein
MSVGFGVFFLFVVGGVTMNEQTDYDIHMDGRTNEQTDGVTNKRTNKQMDYDIHMDGRTDEQTNERTTQQTKERTNEKTDRL